METHGNFKFIPTAIDGVYIVEPKVYGDDRGYFAETYQKAAFDAAGLKYDFIQDNQSKSKKGVLRGLHFQKTFCQAKLVRAMEGEVFDVAVDLRKNSATYGKWVGVTLSAAKFNQLLIPRGFAHGFLTLSDYAVFCYKCDNAYHPEDEGGILWNDPDIAVDWPKIGEVLLSQKDRNNPRLSECRVEL